MRMDQIELVAAPIALVGKRKLALLSKLTCFTSSAFLTTEFGQTEYNLLWLHVLEFREVDVAGPLVPQHISNSTFCPLAYIEVPTSLVSSMNICTSLRPHAITWSPFLIKHLSQLNCTCMPWSTICPTDTQFLVIVSTCKTFFTHPL